MSNYYLTITVLLIALLNPLASLAMHHEEAGNSNTNTTLPKNEGIVVSTIDTTGYTYMELKNGDKEFWIAAPTTEVKVGEHIRFVQSMVMNNFSSKTLNRTFNRIIFVSSTMRKK